MKRCVGGLLVAVLLVALIPVLAKCCEVEISLDASGNCEQCTSGANGAVVVLSNPTGTDMWVQLEVWVWKECPNNPG